MRILLDTHVMLWALYNQERLPEVVRVLMRDEGVFG